MQSPRDLRRSRPPFARQRLHEGHFLVLFVARDKKYIRHAPAGDWLRQPLTWCVGYKHSCARRRNKQKRASAAYTSALPNVSSSLDVLFVWRQKEPKSAFGVTFAALALRAADVSGCRRQLTCRGVATRAATVPLTPFPAKGLCLGRQSRFARMTQDPVGHAGV